MTGVRPAVPSPGPSGQTAPGPGRWRGELWRFLELFALCGFVVVQPLLGVVGEAPDFFIFHGVAGGEAAALVALVALVPPVALWSAGALVGLAGPRARRAAHLAALAGLVGLLMIQLGKQLTPLRGVPLVALAGLATAVVVVGYVRLDATRQLLRFAAVGPLVFVLLFTLTSPASAVLLADQRPSRGGVPEAVGPHPPIVVIVLDEFALVSLLDETGGIDAERFPHLARLAGDATWYRNATATSGWTPYALPSMLSGRWPATDRAPHYAVYPDNLFTLLGEVYRISAGESITQLCPPWYCGDGADPTRGGLPVALAASTSLLGEILSPVDPVRDPYDDYAEPTVRERLGSMAAARRGRPDFRFGQSLSANQPARFHDFVTALGGAAERAATTGPADRSVPDGAADPPADRPELHFLHLLLPHTPWTYLPDGTRYESPPGLPVDGPWWGRLALQRYLLQARYTDRLIGEVLDVLTATGRYDESLVVLTADHGVSLTPGGAGSRELGADDPGIVELAWVPLFVKAPGQTEGEVDDRNWQHVDLLPTIADYAGVEVPWPVDGISWRREARTTPEKTFYPYVDAPQVLDGSAGFARIMADPTAIPPVPPAPLPELVGTAVAAHPVVDGPVRATVENADEVGRVDPATGVVTALVRGTVPAEVPAGTPLAIAVDGRIAAVVPVVDDGEGPHRFAGLIEDPTVFGSGENRLELFLVPDGVTLRRL
jgi:hypothetical protein